MPIFYGCTTHEWGSMHMTWEDGFCGAGVAIPSIQGRDTEVIVCSEITECGTCMLYTDCMYHADVGCADAVTMDFNLCGAGYAYSAEMCPLTQSCAVDETTPEPVAVVESITSVLDGTTVDEACGCVAEDDFD